VLTELALYYLIVLTETIQDGKEAKKARPRIAPEEAIADLSMTLGVAANKKRFPPKHANTLLTSF
jgi:hypothetical protein